MQGGPAGNLRVMTAVYCSQAQALGGEYPRGRLCVGAGRCRAAQGGAGRCMKSQHATCSSLAAVEISSLLHAEINKEHTSHVEGSPAPSSADYSCHYCLLFFLSLYFWKSSTRKRWIRACWLQWLESRTRLNIVLLSPVGPQEGTGVHKWECPA